MDATAGTLQLGAMGATSGGPFFSLFKLLRRPLIPPLTEVVREGKDAGGVNRPARLPPCDGVLWPTGPDTSRRLHYAYMPEVGRRWERMSPARSHRAWPHEGRPGTG